MDMKYNNLLQTPEPWKGLIFPDCLAISSAQSVESCELSRSWVTITHWQNAIYHFVLLFQTVEVAALSHDGHSVAVHCVSKGLVSGFWVRLKVRSCCAVFLANFFKWEISLNGHNNDFVVLSCVLAGLWNWAGNDSRTSRGKEIKSQ